MAKKRKLLAFQLPNFAFPSHRRKFFGRKQDLIKVTFRDKDVNGGATRVRRLASVVARVPGRRVPEDQLGGRLEAVPGIPGADADGDAVARSPTSPSSVSVGVLVVDHPGVVVPEYEPEANAPFVKRTYQSSKVTAERKKEGTAAVRLSLNMLNGLSRKFSPVGTVSRK